MKKGEGEISKTGQEKNVGNLPDFPGNLENVEQEIPESLKENLSQENDSVAFIKEKIPLLPLFAVNFIGSLGFSIVLPFLVILVQQFGGNAFIYGLASSMYTAFQLIGAPILGKWSDIYGRKKILLLSQLGTLLSWIIFLGALFLPTLPLLKVNSEFFGTFTFTLPLAVLFFARAFDGLTGGNISVANAYLADITSEENRSRNFGKMVISENLGYIVGPALAGILSLTEFGVTFPVLGAIIISLTGALLIILYLPEDKKCLFRRPANGSRKILGYEIKKCENTEETKKFNFKEIFSLPYIPYMLGLYFLIDLGYNIFYTSFPMHAIKGLDWSIAEMGFYFTALSALIIIVQSTILPRASRKYPDATLIIFGSFMLGTNFLLLIPGNIFLTYLATGFFALGDGLMWPSFLSLLSKIAGGKYQGTVQGFASSFGSLASINGLILGGFLYEWLSGGAFLIAGLVIYTVFILNFRLINFEKKTSN